MQDITGNFGGRIKAFVDGVEFEPAAQQQVHNVASLPFVFKHVAVMPDCHAGVGSTVGTVIPTRGAIIPAAVGVDIGCGMIAVQLSLFAEHLPDSLQAIRSDIEAAVPHGGLGPTSGWLGKPGGIPDLAIELWETRLSHRFDALCQRYPGLAKGNALIHLGSLGGGNHFIELCLDTNNQVWVMLHSGSRGIGNTIGRLFITKAREMLGERIGRNGVPDKDLAWFATGEPEFNDYIEAMLWAQDFAAENRNVMMERTLDVLKRHLGPFAIARAAINCHHNFANKEIHFGQQVWVTRKGAVSAQAGQLGIIPGSMGAKSYIVRGKGNADSFCSCSHGAGRRMSRTAARKLFNVDDLIAATNGVECRKDEGVIDEIPSAYKDIDAVMAAQTDLVEVVATLKQILCVKG